MLKCAYAAAQAGSVAVGFKDFECKYPSIKDRDVTSQVAGHSQYLDNFKLLYRHNRPHSPSNRQLTQGKIMAELA